MNRESGDRTIFKIQKIILYIVLVDLAAAVIVGQWFDRIGFYLGYGAVILLILAAPVRIMAVAGYFKRTGNSRYQSLSYIIIIIIALTAIIRALF